MVREPDHELVAAGLGAGAVVLVVEVLLGEVVDVVLPDDGSTTSRYELDAVFQWVAR